MDCSLSRLQTAARLGAKCADSGSRPDIILGLSVVSGPSIQTGLGLSVVTGPSNSTHFPTKLNQCRKFHQSSGICFLKPESVYKKTSLIVKSNKSGF